MAAAAFHVRSVSLPSGSHPLAQQFEEQLQKGKNWVDDQASTSSSSSSSTSKSENICNGLQVLAKLHTCANDILKMPEAQQQINRWKHGKWVAEELDGSVRLLDICGSTRDSLSQLKEQTLELQSTLRTRREGHDTITQNKIQKEYSLSLKNTNKCINKSIKEMKKMTEGSNKNSRDLTLAMRTFQEVTTLTIKILTSIFSLFLSQSSAEINNTSGGYWRMLSKATLLKQKSDLGSSSQILVTLGKNIDVVGMQKQLKQMESNISTIQSGFETLFQRLIQNRVELLNIVTM